MQTSSLGPSFEITRLGRAVPSAGFRFEKVGAAAGQVFPVRAGVTDRYVVGAVPPTAVTLNTAAAAPEVGISGVFSGAFGGSPDSTTSRQCPPTMGLLAAPAHS